MIINCVASGWGEGIGICCCNKFYEPVLNCVLYVVCIVLVQELDDIQNLLDNKTS